MLGLYEFRNISLHRESHILKNMWLGYAKNKRVYLSLFLYVCFVLCVFL